LRGLGRHHRTADLGDEFVAQILLVGFDRHLQLLEAAPAQRTVCRPLGLVEGTPRGRDGVVHVVLGRAVVRPNTRPVAGLTLSNSSPDAEATSSPSISILDSARATTRLPSPTLV
jgi:hypothetical protein